MSKAYRGWVECLARENDSRIILALDLFVEDSQKLLARSFEVLKSAAPHICAVKINEPMILSLGLYDKVQRVLELAHGFSLPVIMDCKINDVGHVNLSVVKHYFKVGFDAVTACPFIGWQDGLKPVFELAKHAGRGVVLLVYMSHREAEEGYGRMVMDPVANKLRPQYEVFAEKALKWGADGVVVGATYPDKVKDVYKVLKDEVPIYSPGVVFQGGRLEEAVKSGATYIIIGRALCEAGRVEEAVVGFKEAVNNVLRSLGHR